MSLFLFWFVTAAFGMEFDEMRRLELHGEHMVSESAQFKGEKIYVCTLAHDDDLTMSQLHLDISKADGTNLWGNMFKCIAQQIRLKTSEITFDDEEEREQESWKSKIRRINEFVILEWLQFHDRFLFGIDPKKIHYYGMLDVFPLIFWVNDRINYSLDSNRIFEALQVYEKDFDKEIMKEGIAPKDVKRWMFAEELITNLKFSELRTEGLSLSLQRLRRIMQFLMFPTELVNRVKLAYYEHYYNTYEEFGGGIKKQPQWDAYHRKQAFYAQFKAYVTNIFRKYQDWGTNDPQVEGRYMQDPDDSEIKRRQRERRILNLKHMLYEGDEQLQTWYVTKLEKDTDFGYPNMTTDVIFKFLDLAILEALEKAEEWQEKKGGRRYAEIFPHKEIMEWVDLLMDKFEGWVLDRLYDKSICGMLVDGEERYKPQCFCVIWHLKQLPAVQKYLEFRDNPEVIERKIREKERKKEQQKDDEEKKPADVEAKETEPLQSKEHRRQKAQHDADEM